MSDCGRAKFCTAVLSRWLRALIALRNEAIRAALTDLAIGEPESIARSSSMP